MHSRIRSLATVFLLFPAALFADDPSTTSWVAMSTDPSVFDGSIIISEDGKKRSLTYSFVYDAQVINSNIDTPVPMQATTEACWIGDVPNEFAPSDALPVEVLFCERGDRAYWALLASGPRAARLPAWLELESWSSD